MQVFQAERTASAKSWGHKHWACWKNIQESRVAGAEWVRGRWSRWDQNRSWVGGVRLWKTRRPRYTLFCFTYCDIGRIPWLHYIFFRNITLRTSLVAQWLRIHLPMQGTWVRALGREDPTCRGATKPVCHNYWACALETTSHNYWAHVPQLLKPVRLEPTLLNKRSHRNEKSAHRSKQ